MRIGVLGGGQLGMMLGEAGIMLGHTFVFLEPAEECPAARVGEWIRAPFDDSKALEQLAERSDVITYEFENVPVATVETLAARKPVLPSARSLAVAQDRLAEKRLFGELSIPTPAFERVDSAEDLAAAVDRIGLPAVLKTRRMGYDGRGQRVLRDRDDLAPAFAALEGQALLLEAFVPFDRELSIVAVRRPGNEDLTMPYPLIENRHVGGILRFSHAPALDRTSDSVNPDTSRLRAVVLRHLAGAYSTRLFRALVHTGVLALEMFQVGEELLANEIAPRVHNSGHWTIEGATMSQFETHVRAITNTLERGPLEAPGHSAMVNLIGEVPDLSSLAAIPGTHLHLYGKRPRPGRKLGHITLCAEDAATLDARLEALWRAVPDLARSAGVRSRA